MTRGRLGASAHLHSRLHLPLDALQDGGGGLLHLLPHHGRQPGGASQLHGVVHHNMSTSTQGL